MGEAGGWNSVLGTVSIANPYKNDISVRRQLQEVSLVRIVGSSLP